MIQPILLVILSVMSTTLGFLFYIQRKRNIKILAQTLEFFMLQGQMEQVSKTEKDQTNEDFLKFISDSRDWAYEYIDEVQAALGKFITDIEPEVLFFDQYGDLMSAEPNYNSMKKISGAYKELKKLLPDDYGKIDT
jgi:hypothetical protein